MLKSALLRLTGLQGQPTQSEMYRLEIKQAWEQWQNAQRLFDTVSDPELVDYAIYDVEACRRRYIYMLHKWEEIDKQESVLAQTQA